MAVFRAIKFTRRRGSVETGALGLGDFPLPVNDLFFFLKIVASQLMLLSSSSSTSSSSLHLPPFSLDRL